MAFGTRLAFMERYLLHAMTSSLPLSIVLSIFLLFSAKKRASESENGAEGVIEIDSLLLFALHFTEKSYLTGIINQVGCLKGRLRNVIERSR